jgi:hypothetical protein
MNDGNLLFGSELVGLPFGILSSREVALKDNRLLSSTGSLQLASIAATQKHLCRLPNDIEGL